MASGDPCMKCFRLPCACPWPGPWKPMDAEDTAYALRQWSNEKEARARAEERVAELEAALREIAALHPTKLHGYPCPCPGADARRALRPKAGT